MIIQQLCRTAACVLAVFATASFAVADGVDVLIAEPASGSGATVVGSVDKGVADGDVDASARVFEAEMILEEETPGVFVWETEEPGFFTGSVGVTPTIPAGAVAASDGQTVSVFKAPFAVDGAISDIFYWDGTGPVSFAPAVGAEFELEPEGVIGGGAVVTGGFYDEHPDFLIEGDMGATPDAGVYLVSVTAQLENFDPSDQLFLVFATLDSNFLGLDPTATDEEIEEAVEGFLDPAVDFVETNIIPEPSAALLTALATGVVATRKRR
ncbi:MAG: PEP-CTERM sorting domain-containing protein [Planctomycetota bacterium]